MVDPGAACDTTMQTGFSGELNEIKTVPGCAARPLRLLRSDGTEEI